MCVRAQVKEAMLRSANESIAELQAALESAQADASHAASAAASAEKELEARQAEAAQRQRNHRSAPAPKSCPVQSTSHVLVQSTIMPCAGHFACAHAVHNHALCRHPLCRHLSCARAQHCLHAS